VAFRYRTSRRYRSAGLPLRTWGGRSPSPGRPSPGFEQVASRLTDGTRDYVVFLFDGLTPGVSPSYFESQLVWGDQHDPRVDLNGFVVDSLSLRVDRLAFTSPGRNPNGDGSWTDVSGRFTLSAQGRLVPEPSGSAVLTLVAAAGLMSRGRRGDACRQLRRLRSR
jgi:hypothetical protein